jgi:hypothetical protein
VENIGNSPFFMGKSTISTGPFLANLYVKNKALYMVVH